MRKVAACKVINVLQNRVLPLQVVELESDGICHLCLPLREETCSTEWLSGIIILSPFEVSRVGEESFGGMMNRLRAQVSMHDMKKERAYLVSPFNVADMDFLPSSHVVLLK